jgi:hypothetical protein
LVPVSGRCGCYTFALPIPAMVCNFDLGASWLRLTTRRLSPSHEALRTSWCITVADPLSTGDASAL